MLFYALAFLLAAPSILYCMEAHSIHNDEEIWLEIDVWQQENFYLEKQRKELRENFAQLPLETVEHIATFISGIQLAYFIRSIGGITKQNFKKCQNKHEKEHLFYWINKSRNTSLEQKTLFDHFINFKFLGESTVLWQDLAQLNKKAKQPYTRIKTFNSLLTLYKKNTLDYAQTLSENEASSFCMLRIKLLNEISKNIDSRKKLYEACDSCMLSSRYIWYPVCALTVAGAPPYTSMCWISWYLCATSSIVHTAFCCLPNVCYQCPERQCLKYACNLPDTDRKMSCCDRLNNLSTLLQKIMKIQSAIAKQSTNDEDEIYE